MAKTIAKKRHTSRPVPHREGRAMVRRSRKPSSAPVRLDDVARFAGVSSASVSRTLNSPDLVSADLRARVMHAVQVLKWVPNGAAKALASLRSRTIGVLIPRLGHQNFATLIESLQHELSKRQFTLILGCFETSTELREQQARKMVERGIEHLVLVGEAHPPGLFDLLKSQNTPYVITYTSGRGLGHPCIGFDNYAAATRITEHLLELGHRSFGMIAYLSDGNDRIEQRIAGTRDALARAGIAIKPQHDVRAPDSRYIACGRAGLQQVLSDGRDRPTAVVCTNDYIATGALIEAKALGISVPHELSIVGFDDIDLSAHLDPPLTTIRVPAQKMGEEIARYVIQHLEFGRAETPLPLDAELVVRSSTAAPKKR